ncbi:MAG: hypothetical protein KJ653_05215 [Candidatus Thermoplasmatota archaeon]|nr:hypothetical protein [Candidatus Thermoplasmatota archaeon]MBU1913862.1 hypothetical protein [Candidatus Thermoplasmatota archaeon]
MKGHMKAHGCTLNCGETRKVGVRSRELTKVPFGVPLEKNGSSTGDDAVAILTERGRHHPPHIFGVKPMCLQSSGVDVG